MDRRVKAALWVLLMIAVIVTVDIVFLRGSQDTGMRLLVNVGLVVVFGGAGFALFRRR